ncbi:hypothetical protein [Streptomyces sp. NPDC127197]|uniref:hypothetical protein n=1 Tax=Streptomyces sp. NPDC127197 TaxID=3345388 RepID=UPI0036383B57
MHDNYQLFHSFAVLDEAGGSVRIGQVGEIFTHVARPHCWNPFGAGFKGARAQVIVEELPLGLDLPEPGAVEPLLLFHSERLSLLVSTQDQFFPALGVRPDVFIAPPCLDVVAQESVTSLLQFTGAADVEPPGDQGLELSDLGLDSRAESTTFTSLGLGVAEAAEDEQRGRDAEEKTRDAGDEVCEEATVIPPMVTVSVNTEDEGDGTEG